MGFNFPALIAGIQEASTEQKIVNKPINTTAFQSIMIGIVSR